MSDTPRPTASCGCGYDLVWIGGTWEHDAAPSLWGNDHSPDAGEPEDVEARKYWDRVDSGEPEPSKPVFKVPPFQLDVDGSYEGNSYPSNEVYRVHMVEEIGTENCLLSVEDAAGNEIRDTLTITPEMAEGILRMASTDHGLGAYEDDWTLPPGMDRVVTWDLGSFDTHLVLKGGEIDEIAAWLRFAIGEEKWDGGDEWEY